MEGEPPIIPMQLMDTEDLLIKTEIKQEQGQQGLVDLNNNDELLLPPNANVELLQWDPHWTGTEGEVITLTNLLVDPIFDVFDQESNKVDWEPSSSSDPFSPVDMWAEESLLRNALSSNNKTSIMSNKQAPLLSDVTLHPHHQPPSHSHYYELLVGEPEQEVIIPTHVEELNLNLNLNQQHQQQQQTLTQTQTQPIKGMEISTNTNTLSAKWTYTTTNPDGTPKGRKRTKKVKEVASIVHNNNAPPSPTLLEKAVEIANNSSVKDDGSSRKERSLHYCTICSKGFKDKYSVNVHVRTHTGEKPFACTLCGKSFRQKAHLAKHYQTHAAKANGGIGHHKGHKHKQSITVVSGGAVITATPTSTS